ncbi:putative quinol monooxygenase [Burkholderia diffusa]|uniref:putative quinol monooxygenase n=1 Tax=Burkholderia diffusa TaxID=488732 RepID=UPI002ABDC10C|nr:putative quinol monooxygenase [Burkholderia diffusa]
MKPVTVIAFPVAPPGKEGELAAQFEVLVPATRAEPGCVTFTVHRHPQIANRFAVYEKFCDQAAFDAHLQYAHTRAFVEWLQASGSVLHYEFWSEEA